MSSEEKLKPCPWCGSAPVLERDIFMRDELRINCRNDECPAGGVILYNKDRSALVAAWNSRAAVPSVSCEKLEALVKAWREALMKTSRWDYDERCGIGCDYLLNLEALIEESRRGA